MPTATIEMTAETTTRSTKDESTRESSRSVPEALWAAWVVRRDAALRERILIQYAPLVKYVVGRLAITLPPSLDSDDILSYGTMGLLDAIDRYDPSRGVTFETYAIARIRGSIIDGLRSQDPVSRTARQRSRKIDHAYANLGAELGRPVTDVEVAAHLGMDLSVLHETQLLTSPILVSIDSPVESEDSASATWSDLIPDHHSPDPESLAERREMLHALIGAIKRLPERERLVLALYYDEELTMKEISRVLEVSESRVCQLHSQALLRLRRQLRERAA